MPCTLAPRLLQHSVMLARELPIDATLLTRAHLKPFVADSLSYARHSILQVLLLLHDSAHLHVCPSEVPHSPTRGVAGLDQVSICGPLLVDEQSKVCACLCASALP